MNEMLENKEPIIVTGKVIVPYKYSVGSIGSRFLIALRDDKKIIGMKCPTCNKVYLPPRVVCSTCYGQLDEWVDLDGKGTLQTYVVVHYALQVHPVEPPFAYGIIKLDGADTGLTHLLGEMDLNEISMGMRVEPVFREERQGNILDIKYFRPIST